MKHNKLNENSELQVQQDNKCRRDFIKKFGKLAVVTPIAVTTLMSTYSSKAMASAGGAGTSDEFI